MDGHLTGLDERASAAFEYIETTGYEIYGSPSDGVRETMNGFAARLGAPLSIYPINLAGYIRMS
jgi:hypothetical protein